MRLVSESAFGVIWAWIAAGTAAGWDLLVRLAGAVAAYLPESVRPFFELGTAPSIALTVFLLLFLAGGFWIGRRH